MYLPCEAGIYAVGMGRRGVDWATVSGQDLDVDGGVVCCFFGSGGACVSDLVGGRDLGNNYLIVVRKPKRVWPVGE